MQTNIESNVITTGFRHISSAISRGDTKSMELWFAIESIIPQYQHLMECYASNNPSVVDAFLSAAEQKNNLLELIGQKDPQTGLNILEKCIQDNNWEMIKKLTQIQNYQMNIDVKHFMHLLATACLKHKKMELIPILNDLKELLPESSYTTPVKLFSKDARITTEAKAEKELYGQVLPCQPVKTKKEAIKKAVVQYYSLLETPTRCIPYLHFLNKELIRYFKHKHADKDFPTIDPNHYYFEIIDGVNYPIPVASYKDVKKFHALQEFLNALFKKYGMANKAEKWGGYIPSKIANEHVAVGDFISEDALSYAALLHGKLAHMIQQAILIYAIEAGEIEMEYGDKQKLSVIDILQALVTQKIPTDNNDNQNANVEKSFWNMIRDTVDPYQVSFSDPHRLTSTIMCEGKKLGLDALSDYLIDAFCSDLKKIVKECHETEGLEEMSQEDLVNLLKSIDRNTFKTPKFLLDKMENKVQAQNKQETSQIGLTYVITSMFYDVDSSFIPATYTDSEEAELKFQQKTS